MKMTRDIDSGVAKQKVNILLVDDKESNLEALEGVLVDLDQNLVRASSANDALKYLLENDVGVILLDVQMPVMDGFQIAELIRRNKCLDDTPIIMVTAHFKEDEDILKGYDLGVNDYLLKPLVSDVVLRKVGLFVELYKKTKANERMIEEVNRSNKELEQFVYAASHDLQAPLRHIASYVEMLETESPTHEESKQWMKYVIEGVSTMQSHIDGILKYSSVGKHGKIFKQIDMAIVVHNVLGILRIPLSESGCNIVVGDMPVIVASEINMNQLFLNLIENAMKFMKPDTVPQIRVGVTETARFWEFSVSDNGIGMHNKDQDRIFEMFRRLHTRAEYPGSGIGLSLCKKVVEIHGGKIWVNSAPDKGAIFSFTIAKNLC